MQPENEAAMAREPEREKEEEKYPKLEPELSCRHPACLRVYKKFRHGREDTGVGGPRRLADFTGTDKP